VQDEGIEEALMWAAEQAKQVQDQDFPMDEGVNNALIWAANQAQEMLQLKIDAQLWAAQQEALVGQLAADPQLAWRPFPQCADRHYWNADSNGNHDPRTNLSIFVGPKNPWICS
jgi:hypothetical protein